MKVTIHQPDVDLVGDVEDGLLLERLGSFLDRLARHLRREETKKSHINFLPLSYQLSYQLFTTFISTFISTFHINFLQLNLDLDPFPTRVLSTENKMKKKIKSLFQLEKQSKIKKKEKK